MGGLEKLTNKVPNREKLVNKVPNREKLGNKDKIQQGNRVTTPKKLRNMDNGRTINISWILERSWK